MSIKVICILVLCRISMYEAKAQIGFGTVSTDTKGRVITTYKLIDPDGNQTQIYLGSPYLGDSVWHKGALTYSSQRQQPGELSFNLSLNQIQYRFTDSSVAINALPDEFIFEGARFVAKPRTNGLALSKITYYQVLYAGKTRLLRRWQKQFRILDRNSYPTKTGFDDMFNGQYTTFQELYIEKTGEKPRLVLLELQSIRKVLGKLPPVLLDYLKANDLTENALIHTLTQYDRLGY